jgi:coenzyme PQQ synthesis protein D (PqqD)
VESRRNSNLLATGTDRDHSFECNAPDVVFENFGDEAVILNLQSGHYFSLNGVGITYWEYLVQAVPANQVNAHIVGCYSANGNGATISQDLDELFDQLHSEGLIRASNVIKTINDVANTTALPTAYARPMLAKFDDVAEMLLLDPVHDVSSEVGWPHPAPANRVSPE